MHVFRAVRWIGRQVFRVKGSKCNEG
jgi:hypothetical protein